MRFETSLRLLCFFFSLNNVVVVFVVGGRDYSGRSLSQHHLVSSGHGKAGTAGVGGTSPSQPMVLKSNESNIRSSRARVGHGRNDDVMRSKMVGKSLFQPVVVSSGKLNASRFGATGGGGGSVGRNRMVGKSISEPVQVITGEFDVKRFGAKGDGRTDDTKAFTNAWRAACGHRGPAVKVLIPEGTYLLGPVEFVGPCKYAQAVTVLMKGYLKATTDLSKYGTSDAWVKFRRVGGLTLTGGGTFDGQGASSWPFNKCPKNAKCRLLPTNVKFVAMTETVVRGIKSVNSKYFHVAVVACKNFKGSGIMISAPGNSPNTDGIHIERSTDVYISRSVIRTGDDCISLGQGNTHVTINGITCGPGHGISVGSLGRYPDEKDVNGLVVRDCILTGTTNGIRIKTWANSPASSSASNMTFENLVMNNVGNPIIIDQTYCPFVSCTSKTPSRVKLSNIYFKNIRGTSSSPVAVKLHCSKGIPCENINLVDVHLDLSSGGNRPKSTCQNILAKYSGIQVPPPCV